MRSDLDRILNDRLQRGCVHRRNRVQFGFHVENRVLRQARFDDAVVYLNISSLRIRLEAGRTGP